MSLIHVVYYTNMDSSGIFSEHIEEVIKKRLKDFKYSFLKCFDTEDVYLQIPLGKKGNSSNEDLLRAIYNTFEDLKMCYPSFVQIDEEIIKDDR